MKKSGNTIFITGGATGIGLALAKAFMKNDNEVVICGRRHDKLKVAKSILPSLHIKVCDITNKRSLLTLVEWATKRFKSLNVLVNNAGIQRSVDFTRGPKDLIMAEAEIAVNLTAPIQLSVLMIPHLRRQKQSAIINISSGLAFTPLADVPVYSATKAAVHSFSLSLRHQLRNTLTRVFEVAPPMVATALSGQRPRPEEAGLSVTGRCCTGNPQGF